MEYDHYTKLLIELLKAFWRDICLGVTKNISFIKLTPESDKIQFYHNYELSYLNQMLCKQSQVPDLRVIEKLNLLKKHKNRRILNQAKFTLDSIRSIFGNYELSDHLVLTINQLSYFNKVMLNELVFKGRFMSNL
ncbi:hypothetical protein K502DRAFT_348796 [Neoconidiobolus thromboides FSU 785]|nr:hypothetical protein K502DRAFT_348796 [Neoconidiobolus thromboides FSU 785]